MDKQVFLAGVLLLLTLILIGVVFYQIGEEEVRESKRAKKND